ncbi:MAG: hypothetical protein WB696_23725, partial [Chthoniobacterales bacterium]
VVLRQGRTVGQVPASAASVDDLVRAMMSGKLQVRHAPERRLSEPSEPFGGLTSTTELPPDERNVASMLGRLRSIFSSQSAALFLVLVTLAVFFSVLRPDAFPRVGNIMNMATNASVLLVLAVGSMFVILTGGIDLSIIAFSSSLA